MKTLILAAALAASFSAATQAATVLNGSFEDNAGVSDAFGTVYMGDNTYIPGWTVAEGNIDLIRTYWENQDGQFSVDLDGNQMGTIVGSIVDLMVGKAYDLSFFMAGNPDGGPDIKKVTVIAGATQDQFTFDATSTSTAAMGWLRYTMRFVATAETESVTFVSSHRNGSFFGAAIDNVAVSPVPLPAAAPLLLAALGGLVLLRRRRRA